MDYSASYMKLPFLIMLGLIISSNIAVTHQKTDELQLQDKLLLKELESLIESYGSLVRKKRADPCPDGKQITNVTIQDLLFPMEYPVDLLNACLDGKTVVENLYNLCSTALSTEQLQVCKNKLDGIYPNGLPDSVISKLDCFYTIYSSDEIITKWNITSLQTFAMVLKASTSDSMAKAVITRYMQLGNPLNATVLDIINSVNRGYVCLLDEDQLRTISPEAIRNLSTSIDISSCTQPKKNILFNTSIDAFANITDPRQQFVKVEPYIGGAPAGYLKALAKVPVAIGMSDFLTLNPSETPKLTVSEVQELLGQQIIALKDNQNNPAVKAWIQSQKQSDLDKLKIGLTGGILECPSNMQITSQNVGNASLPNYYPVTILDACLSNDTLKNNLSSLGQQNFNEEQMNVIKRRLSQLYPNQLPDGVLRNLGNIGGIYSLNDIINTWNINTPETLGELLRHASTDDRVRTIIQKYLSAKPQMDAATLNALNDYVCFLDENQLSVIPPPAIREAKRPLNISTCTQPKKNILYGIASTAFADKKPNPATYYPLIEPYLSGASADDLRNLAQMNVSMNMPTFLSLNKDAVMNLTASNVADLLGINLPYLQNYRNDPLVSAFLKNLNQSDLIKLGLQNPEPPITPIGYYVIPKEPGSAASSSKMRLLYVIEIVLASSMIIPLL